MSDILQFFHGSYKNVNSLRCHNEHVSVVLEGTTTHIVRLQREKKSRYKGDEVGAKHECLKVFGKFNRSVTKRVQK